MFLEVTYVGDGGELYVDIDADTGEALDVYGERPDAQALTPFLQWKPGPNPLFVHCTDPHGAYLLLRQLWVSTAD